MTAARTRTPSIFSGHLDPDDLRALAERLRVIGENPLQLLTEQEVADRLSISLAGLRKLRADGTGPAWSRIGRAVRHRLIDVEAYLVHHEAEGYESNLCRGGRQKYLDAVNAASEAR